MAKTVKIPDNMRPWKATINGIDYVYPAGTTQEVPDEVAALIERISNVQPEKEPNMPPFTVGAQADMNAAEGEPGHVLNRTHYEETTTVTGDTLTWDGNTEGLEIVDFGEGIPLYKVSETVPTYDQLLNGLQYTMVYEGRTDEVHVGQEYIKENTYIEDGIAYILMLDGVLFCFTDTDFPDYGLHGEKGVYFLKFSDDIYVTSLTIPGYNGFVSEQTIIHKLDPKFLPDGLPYVESNGVLLEESNAHTITHPTFGQMWNVQQAVNLEVGKTYTVTYNGTAYTCVCQAAPAGLVEDPAAVAMGNFSVVGGANTGEPFAMLISYVNREVVIIDLSGAASVRVEIRGEVYHKLDPRFVETFTVNVYATVSTNDWVPVISVDKTRDEILAHLDNSNLPIRAVIHTDPSVGISCADIVIATSVQVYDEAGYVYFFADALDEASISLYKVALRFNGEVCECRAFEIVLQ